jgi:hypothetical protein
MLVQGVASGAVAERRVIGVVGAAALWYGGRIKQQGHNGPTGAGANEVSSQPDENSNEQEQRDEDREAENQGVLTKETIRGEQKGTPETGTRVPVSGERDPLYSNPVRCFRTRRLIASPGKSIRCG